jgi:hypothetical protein
MNWKSGLFRVWLAASACWVAYAAWGAYVDIVVPRLQLSVCIERLNACLSAREANPKLGNPFDCESDNPPPPQGLFQDLIEGYTHHYGWFGEPVPPSSCTLLAIHEPWYMWPWIPGHTALVMHAALAFAPPLSVVLFFCIGAWVASGFRRSTG